MFSPNDYGANHKLLPLKNYEGYKPPEPTLARHEPGRGNDDNQKLEWIRAIQGGPAPLSNFDYAAVLTETMLLGNVAVRTGKRLDYDAETQTCKNCPQAAQFIKPEFREGWKL